MSFSVLCDTAVSLLCEGSEGGESRSKSSRGSLVAWRASRNYACVAWCVLTKATQSRVRAKIKKLIFVGGCPRDVQGCPSAWVTKARMVFSAPWIVVGCWPSRVFCVSRPTITRVCAVLSTRPTWHLSVLRRKRRIGLRTMSYFARASRHLGF